MTLGVTTIVSYGTTQYLFGVLVVPIGQELGWSRGLISGAFSLGILVAGGLGVVVGRLADRHGARGLMAAGSGVAGLSLIGLARVTEPWQFYALWAGGIGVAMALTLYPITFTVIANWFQRKRGRALAILTLLGGLASPIFIPLAGWLVSRTGWRMTVVVLGALQLVIALPLHAFLLRRHPEDLGLLPDGEPQSRGSEARGGFGSDTAAGRSAAALLDADRCGRPEPAGRECGPRAPDRLYDRPRL